MKQIKIKKIEFVLLDLTSSKIKTGNSYKYKLSLSSVSETYLL